MSKTYQQKIESKYSDLQGIFGDDDTLNILLRLLAESLVIIADCNADIDANGLVVKSAMTVKANPSIGTRATSVKVTPNDTLQPL